MDKIFTYFPNLSDQQRSQIKRLGPLYMEWNEKINVVSRKDIDNLYLHHVLHSLAIGKFIHFRDGSEVLDLGTGGGFPGIPLAILFPEVSFTLIDGTAKKIRVAQEVAMELGLKNVTALPIRSEDMMQPFDFVVTRAVASLDQLNTWCYRLFKKKMQNALPNGIIALKGGDIQAEIKAMTRKEYTEVYAIDKFFPEEYFKEKFVVYVQA